MPQLRSQIICGMYGRTKAGTIADCWAEPAGLAPHSGLTPELACKFINHSNKAVNEFINSSRYLKHMGPVGRWSQGDIDRLVLPTAGEMEVDELDDDLLELEHLQNEGDE